MECAVCHIFLPDASAFCHACGARQEGVPELEAGKYAAFISYRHIPRDREVAIAVQKAIETYRLPKEVVAPEALLSGDRGLGKCFRDDDELAASSSLPDRIADALAASRALIVVCSPEAAQSEWIAREIQLFAQMHGRKRIFAVLAAGESTEAMPASLREMTVIADDGEIEIQRTEPLAADLRPTSGKRPSDEKLRVVAAVAGCAYDDLRQRTVARRRKRTTAIVATVLAIAAVIGIFAWFAHVNRQSALVEESLHLAYESQQQLSQGDRYGAIRTALSALPASEADSSRPLVPEAQKALEKALQIDLVRGSLWRTAYSINTENPISMLGNGVAHLLDTLAVGTGTYAIDAEENILIISDDNGAVNTYDMATGKHLARCTTPDETASIVGGTYLRVLAAANGRVVVSHRGAPSSLTCFDSRTGERIWNQDKGSLSLMDMLPSGDYISGVALINSGGFDALLLDVATGKTGLVSHFDEELPSAEEGAEGVIGRTLNDYYLAVGDKLERLDVAGDSVAATAELARPCVTSLIWQPGAVVVASADPIPEEGFERFYAIEAFDEDLNLLWRYEGSFVSQMVLSEQATAFLEGAPIVGGFACGGTQVAVAVGREAILLDLATGELLFTHHAAQTILEAHPIDSGIPGVASMVVSCVDGTATIRVYAPDKDDNGGDSARLTLSYPIRWAHACVVGSDLMVLAAPADDDDRIVAYRADFSSLSEDGKDGEDQGKEKQDGETQEYTLDQLIELARAELASSGR